MDFFLFFIIGLIFGSFLNVVIYRLKTPPRRGGTAKGIIFGCSFCPECKVRLKWYDLIPILSFIYLRGRCRYCRKKISWHYPIVEILSGLIWILVFYKIYGRINLLEQTYAGQDLQFLNLLNFFYYILIFSALLVIAVYDFKWRIIPDKIIYPAIIAAILYNSFLALKFGDWQNYFLNPLLIAVVLFAFLFFIFYFSSGRSMGLGDAKLAFLIGLFLSPLLAIVAFMLAFIIGAVFGIILIGISKIPHPLVYKGWGIKSQVAFGPFLVIGATIAFFFSDFIIRFIDLQNLF